MPVAHPATHGPIDLDRPYPIITFPYHVSSSTAAPVNRINTTSNRCLPRYLIITFPVLIIRIFPLLRRYSSDDAIVCLSSTSFQTVLKRTKCLTQRLTLLRIQVWICAMKLSPLAYRHSLQSTPEPVTFFSQCSLSCLSCCANAPPGCRTSSLALGAFISNGFFNA